MRKPKIRSDIPGVRSPCSRLALFRWRERLTKQGVGSNKTSRATGGDELQSLLRSRLREIFRGEDQNLNSDRDVAYPRKRRREVYWQRGSGTHTGEKMLRSRSPGTPGGVGNLVPSGSYEKTQKRLVVILSESG